VIFNGHMLTVELPLANDLNGAQRLNASRGLRAGGLNVLNVASFSAAACGPPLFYGAAVGTGRFMGFCGETISFVSRGNDSHGIQHRAITTSVLS
jgi:hypothetical protein